MDNATLIERLRSIDCMNVEECFLDSHMYTEAADRIAALEAENERLREALEPFNPDFEIPIVDENGWTDFGISWCRDRIVDWFGPSDFRRARAAL